MEEQAGVKLRATSNDVETRVISTIIASDHEEETKEKLHLAYQNEKEEEEEEDRKPAAKDSDSQTLVVNNDGKGNDGPDEAVASDGSEESDEEKSRNLVSEDGRTLSAYEMQRLERIKRNREYLAQLGLVGKDGGKIHRNQKKRKKHPKKDLSSAVRRSSLSRKTKVKSVRYREPSNAAWDFFHVKDKQESTNDPSLVNPASSQQAENDILVTKEPHSRPESSFNRNYGEKRDKIVFFEFKHIGSSKTQALRLAKRNFRAAENEAKYWQRLVNRWERRVEVQNRNGTETKIQAALASKTAKELLHEIDGQMPEIIAALRHYDKILEAKRVNQMAESQRIEAEAKRKLTEAIDGFPKAMKRAVMLLNSALLERTPSDSAALRRSMRSADASEEENDSIISDLCSESYEEIVLHELESKIDQATDAKQVTCSHKEYRDKRRIPISKNVGGWISPDFADKVDRSWLEDNTPSKAFDPSKYVPQPGDIVLYYISGHKKFLDTFPDTLGEKAQIKSRVPLWNRMGTSKEVVKTLQRRGDKARVQNRWFSDDWLDCLESFEMGNYPLLCKVKETHIEFPPDPSTKIFKKTDVTDALRIRFRKPKANVLDTASSQLRLAVSLQPLTPLSSPFQSDRNGDCKTRTIGSLDLPPLFSVVTFPSDLDPFLIPFGWAYVQSHSLSIKQTVRIRQDKSDSNLEVIECGKYHLKEKASEIQNVLSYFDMASSKTEALETLLGDNPISISWRDAIVVLDVWSRNVPRYTLNINGAGFKTISFMDLVISTLPIWKSVTVIQNNSIKTKKTLSPWQLVPLCKKNQWCSPWNIYEHLYQLDEILRDKIVGAVQNIVSENALAAEVFIDPVTEDVAPAYCCAVPCGMSISKILERLKAHGPEGKFVCYYRSVEAIKSDVSSIVDACLLYNQPDSEVVVDAVNFVSLVQDEITKVLRERIQEMRKCRKNNDDRRLDLLQQSGKSYESLKYGAFLLARWRKPLKEPLYREWLEQTYPENLSNEISSAVSSTGKRTTFSPLCPQAGDSVFYSKELHAHFLKGHSASLEADQCIVLNLPNAKSDSSFAELESRFSSSVCSWIKGEVVTARAVFPKFSSKHTFCSESTLLAMDIKFPDETVSVVYWRPCLFHFDSSPIPHVCPGCNMASNASFIRVECDNVPHDAALLKHSDNTIIDELSTTSIDRCITLLKKRCLKQIPFASTDPQLTIENVNEGYKTPVTKIRLDSLPDFNQLFSSKSVKSCHDTRGISLKQPNENTSIDLLLTSGFLPMWVSRSKGGAVDENALRKSEAIVPSARLSLALIHIRLKKKFYRRKAAIINDLVEAFIISTILMLSNPATNKKRSQVNIRRLVLALTSKDEYASSEDCLTNDFKLTEEENEILQRLYRVRELYSAALVSVTDTEYSERVFGIVSLLRTPQVITKDPDPSRVAAREKVALIIRSLHRDKCLNTFGDAEEWGQPIVKLTIKCGGRPFSYSPRILSASVSPLIAVIKDKPTNVKLISGGHSVSFGNVSLVESPIDMGSSRQSSVVAPPIYFGPNVYGRSDELGRFLFKRQCRSNACARCQAYRRSMVACRVGKRHSNPDFDLLTDMPNGINHLNDLLDKLQTLRLANNEDSINISSVDQLLQSEKRSQEQQNINIDRRIEEDKNEENTNIVQNDSQIDRSDNKTTHDIIVKDPNECSKKANLALQMSMEVLKEVKVFAAAPIRLSKEFIEKEFPLDQDDDHYLYCIICGRSGSLLCCDGCPNVIHPECVGLDELPKGDWFCEECIQAKLVKSSTEVSADGKHVSSDKGSNLPLPFGRIKFDMTNLNHVTSMLDDLRALRPTQRIKTMGKNNEASRGGSIDDNDDVEIFRKRKSHLAYDYGKDHGERLSRKRSKKQNVKHSDNPPPQQRLTRKAPSIRSSQEKLDREGKLSAYSMPYSFDVLSETAQQFVQSIGIQTPMDFLSCRTSDLAPKLVEWREEKGMPRLQGSGPSASVSAWKTLVRNAIEETVIEDVDASTDKEDEEDKESVDFDVDPLEFLSEKAKLFLQSIGIKSASDFMSMRTTDIASKFASWREKKGICELKGNGSIASVSGWKSIVKEMARKMGLKWIAEIEPMVSSNTKKRTQDGVGIEQGSLERLCRISPRRLTESR